METEDETDWFREAIRAVVPWSRRTSAPPFPMLALHSPLSHLRRRIICCHLCGPSWIECDLCQISLPYAYLTMDVCSYQYEQWCSMDRLYMPKNLWVNHSTHWTLFYSLQRQIHLQKVEKMKNPNRIQINCLSPFVVSPNFLTVQLWLSYVSWCFHDHWAYLIVINFRHILTPFRGFICPR